MGSDSRHQSYQQLRTKIWNEKQHIEQKTQTKQIPSNQKASIEILPACYHQELSPAAISLYVWVWNRFAYKGMTTMWANDEEAATRSRMPLSMLAGAQSELARAGLLIMIPGDGQTQYTFVEDPDNPDDLDIAASN
jgi:hypothetical protein